jgi:hypothetical protein
MVKRTYTKREGVSLLFKIPYTVWTVRNSKGRKIGIIRKDGEAFTACAGHYDRNDNFVSSASGRSCATYAQAQAFFRGNE